MSEFVEPFDLSFLESGAHLARRLEQQFHAPVTALSRVGQGFYAHIYKASLDGAPHEVIVKCHQYAGRGVKEKQQLETLREHATAKLPEVYALYLPAPDFPCEAMVMEYIPGVNASDVAFPDDASRARFVDCVVENLLAWHAVSNPQGFGELEGPFHRTWTGCLGQRIGLYHAHLQRDRHGTVVSPYVMRIIDRSFEALDDVFSGASRVSSLVHSDYNAWNMRVDPATFELTGIIDPIDAGWSDCEIDLFHLPNCRPELGLLERYLQDTPVDDAFWMRFKFYRFWDDVKHYLRMGWYEEQRFRTFAGELDAAMDRLLPHRCPRSMPAIDAREKEPVCPTCSSNYTN